MSTRQLVLRIQVANSQVFYLQILLLSGENDVNNMLNMEAGELRVG